MPGAWVHSNLKLFQNAVVQNVHQTKKGVWRQKINIIDESWNAPILQDVCNSSFYQSALLLQHNVCNVYQSIFSKNALLVSARDLQSMCSKSILFSDKSFYKEGEAKTTVGIVFLSVQSYSSPDACNAYFSNSVIQFKPNVINCIVVFPTVRSCLGFFQQCNPISAKWLYNSALLCSCKITFLTVRPYFVEMILSNSNFSKIIFPTLRSYSISERWFF